MTRWIVLRLLLLILLCGAERFAIAAAIDEYARLVSAGPSLAAYWRFEGDLSDAKELAPAEAKGGDPQFVAGPNGGTALRLADGRFVTMGPTPHLDLPRTTVELWFRPNFAPNPPYNPCLIAKRASSPETRFSLHLEHDYSALDMWNGRQVIRFQPPGGPLQRGQWYYVAVTCAGDDLRLYLDGVECIARSGPGTFSFDKLNLPLSVGSSAPEGVEHLEADVDEVAIYSEALSAEDIARHADAMGWRERRELLAQLERERIQREETLMAEREAKRAEKLKALMADKRLFARGRPQVLKGEHLEAISLPVGGIGAGCIQYDGKGRAAVWQIFNNFNNAFVPDSFLAVRVKSARGEPILRALQTEPVGPFAAMAKPGFRGEYPIGSYRFDDPELPVEVTHTVLNPLIPLDTRSSSIPCVIHEITVRNRTRARVEVTLLATQQNAVGFTGQGEIEGRSVAGYGGNVNRTVRENGATILHMTQDGPRDAPGYGDMALAALAYDASAACSWESPEALADGLAPNGALAGPEQAGPSPAGETLNGALAVPLSLKPGGQQRVTFVLTWHFPNATHGAGEWGGTGNMYANWWPDALAVAREVIARLDELVGGTHLYTHTLSATNLPHWLLGRISSQVGALRSKTCFWTKDGYLGGWEGCCPETGCCHGNCNHVWHYAQAHARLFPEIARTMREQEFRFQAADGAIPHRQPSSFPAFDGQCGAVLNSLREHLMSPNREWLDRNWPHVKRAMDYIIATWDPDEDGVLAGAQWNTLDGALGGSTTWLGSLYLAALAAAERMATLEADADSAARYLRLRQSGAPKQDATLFNGEYYIQIPDPEPREDYLTGCHIDQVLGQWWAHQLDLGWLYPPEHVRTALQSLLRHNFRADFVGIRQAPRKFVDDNDAGLQMITWPQGDRPAKHTLYADEAMTGFEYSAAAAMVQAGLMREGFTVVRAVADRYDGRLRTGLTAADTASWGYSGNPFGDDECGKFYARPMSVWSMLLACQGFIYDGPAGRIGFRPAWQPKDHVSFYTAAEGWGLFTQKRRGRTQTEQLKVSYGTLRIEQLIFELPDGAKRPQVAVRSGRRSLATQHTLMDGELRISLRETITLERGQTLRITVSW